MKKLLLATTLLFATSAFARNNEMLTLMANEIKASDQFASQERETATSYQQLSGTVTCSNFEIKNKMKMPSVAKRTTLTVYTVTADCLFGDHTDGQDKRVSLVSLVTAFEEKSSSGADNDLFLDVRSVILLPVPGLE